MHSSPWISVSASSRSNSATTTNGSGLRRKRRGRDDASSGRGSDRHRAVSARSPGLSGATRADCRSDRLQAPAAGPRVELAATAAGEPRERRERETLHPARREGGLHLLLELAREEREVDGPGDALQHRAALLCERDGRLEELL